MYEGNVVVVGDEKDDSNIDLGYEQKLKNYQFVNHLKIEKQQLAQLEQLESEQLIEFNNNYYLALDKIEQLYSKQQQAQISLSIQVYCKEKEVKFEQQIIDELIQQKKSNNSINLGLVYSTINVQNMCIGNFLVMLQIKDKDINKELNNNIGFNRLNEQMNLENQVGLILTDQSFLTIYFLDFIYKLEKYSKIKKKILLIMINNDIKTYNLIDTYELEREKRKNTDVMTLIIELEKDKMILDSGQLIRSYDLTMD